MLRRSCWKLAASVGVVCLSATLAYAAETVTYTYDSRGRLVKVEKNGTINDGVKTEYHYDKADNRSNVTVTGSPIVGTPGNDTLNGTSGNDRIAGLAGSDAFFLQQGGSDTAFGGDGSDGMLFGAALDAADAVDGEAGSDQVAVQGNYAGLTLGANNLANVESLVLLSGSDTRFGDSGGHTYSYNFTSVDANVAAGVQLIVTGTALLSGEAMTFNGSAETNGSLRLLAGAGADQLTGGAANDILYGGLGKDRLTGNSGADTYQFTAAAQSSGAGYDTIVGFDYQVDRIDLNVTVTSFGSTIATGQLAQASFDTDMATAMSSLAAGQARLFTPNSGGLAGKTFLVVDLNATAGYQSGADLVIEMEQPAVAIAQTTTIFI
jgi:serralysin